MASGKFAAGKLAAGKFAARKIRRRENSPWENSPLGKFTPGKFAPGKFAAWKIRRGEIWLRAPDPLTGLPIPPPSILDPPQKIGYLDVSDDFEQNFLFTS